MTNASDECSSTRRARAFTRTQLAIVDSIAAGQTDKEIAYKVGISYRTVRTHLERLYDLNSVHCRAALVALVAHRRQHSELHPESEDGEGVLAP